MNRRYVDVSLNTDLATESEAWFSGALESCISFVEMKEPNVWWKDSEMTTFSFKTV